MFVVITTTIVNIIISLWLLLYIIYSVNEIVSPTWIFLRKNWDFCLDDAVWHRYISPRIIQSEYVIHKEVLKWRDITDEWCNMFELYYDLAPFVTSQSTVQLSCGHDQMNWRFWCLFVGWLGSLLMAKDWNDVTTCGFPWCFPHTTQTKYVT